MSLKDNHNSIIASGIVPRHDNLNNKANKVINRFILMCNEGNHPIYFSQWKYWFELTLRVSDIIKNNIDRLMISVAKLDSSFPNGQFQLHGYSEPWKWKWWWNTCIYPRGYASKTIWFSNENRRVLHWIESKKEKLCYSYIIILNILKYHLKEVGKDLDVLTTKLIPPPVNCLPGWLPPGSSPKIIAPGQYPPGNCTRGKLSFGWYVAPRTNGSEEKCPSGKLSQGYFFPKNQKSKYFKW